MQIDEYVEMYKLQNNPNRKELMKFRKFMLFVEKLSKKHSFDLDKVDWISRFDGRLSLGENKNQIELWLQEHGFIEKIPTKEEIEAMEREAREREEEYYQQLEMEALEKLKEIDYKIDKYYERMIDFINMAIDGYANCVILKSPFGWGKTFQVLKTLQKRGLKKDKDYAEIKTFSSPLELFNLLYKYKDMKVIVVDDVYGLLTNEAILSILMSATWSVSGERFVEYNSTTKKKEIDKFPIKANLIICLNYTGINKLLQGLISRSILYDMEKELDYYTKLKILYEIAKKKPNDLPKDIRIEIVDYIKDNTNEASEFSIRTYEHICNIYKYSVKSSRDWKELAYGLLGTDSDLELVKELMRSGLPVKEQVKEFIERTGKSRATFFRYKQVIQTGRNKIKSLTMRPNETEKKQNCDEKTDMRQQKLEKSLKVS